MSDSAETNFSSITELSRQQLAEDFGLRMSVDVGDPFFNALFYGTLKTFAERVDSSGFCLTSFGEENGVRCYGRVHYPRDADSVVRVLADVGLTEPAIRILEFTLGHVPDGQYYIPHIYRADGSIKANTIQMDTPAHTILALSRCVDLCGPTPRLARLYEILLRIALSSWQHHFHAGIGLLDAGNYNEQLDTQAVTCDLFTNCAMHAGFAELARVAAAFGDASAVQTCAARAAELAAGIERRLYDVNQDVYLTRHDLGGSTSGGDFKWINLYPQRWYTGRSQAWDNALRRLEETTSIDWGPFRVISGYPTRDSILGKAFGHLLAFLAQRGRFEMLSHHLSFAKATIRRPSHIYPEAWLYRRNPAPSEYEVGFWQRFAGVWQAFCDDPAGDYTMDSGNAEQCAAFLRHFIEDLLGIEFVETRVRLSPKLPFDFTHVRVTDAPVSHIDGHTATLGYHLRRGDGRTDLAIHRNGDFALEISLPLPGDARAIQLSTDDRPAADCPTERRGEICTVSVSLPAAKQASSDHRITCTYQQDRC